MLVPSKSWREDTRHFHTLKVLKRAHARLGQGMFLALAHSVPKERTCRPDEKESES